MKGKNKKQPVWKNTIHRAWKNKEISIFIIGSDASEDSGATSLKNWQQKIINLELYTQQKYVSKIKVKYRFFSDVKKL